MKLIGFTLEQIAHAVSVVNTGADAVDQIKFLCTDPPEGTDPAHIEGFVRYHRKGPRDDLLWYVVAMKFLTQLYLQNIDGKVELTLSPDTKQMKFICFNDFLAQSDQIRAHMAKR